jgi:hypothetical protein
MKSPAREITESIQALNEMAMSRKKWENDFRNKLRGALREYTKLVIARYLGQQDFWSNEVRTILKDSKPYMETVKTKSDFDREVALKEVVLEATDGSQVVAAKNIYIKQHPEDFKKIKAMDLDQDKLMPDMIKEFLPWVKL